METGEIMVNQQKVAIMTKLALYDKHEGPADRDANEFFRHDYIYKKNLGTRMAVGFGGLLLLALHWLRMILIDGLDVLQVALVRGHLIESLMFLAAILAVYSLIGTLQGTREYYLIQKRLKKYNGLVRQLEKLENK